MNKRNREGYRVPPGVVARVFKAGNSLIAKRIGLEDGAAVEMTVDQGMIYVRKGSSRALTDLIERIAPENLPDQLFEEPTGAERW